MSRRRKIFLLCPWHQTGGPENIHQLCHAINTATGHDFEAFVHYYQAGPGYPEVPATGVLYVGDGMYPPESIQRAAAIEDAPGNVVVIPEVLPVEAVAGLRWSRIVIWWLSLGFGLPWKDRHLEACRAGAWMAFHAHHAWNTIVPELDNDEAAGRCVFLSDYIRDAFWNFPWQPAAKEDLVVFNANRDTRTAHFAARMGVPAIGLRGLAPPEVMAILARAKVYFDQGFHPGKDHLPREAAILGCVVITNRDGCAACHEDLPIAEKYDSDQGFLSSIGEAFMNYPAAYERQSAYHAKLRAEKAEFSQQVRDLLARIPG